MPRLRSTATGVVVNVDEATASQLTSEFVSVEADAKPESARRAPTKKSDSK